MSAVSDVAFAMFALQQPLTLSEIATAAANRRLPLADSQTPDWFAAAASTGSSLLDMAPELQVLPTDLVEPVDVEGIDLVHIYAPELASLEELDVETPTVPEPTQESKTVAAPQVGAAAQLGLLKELSELDE